MIFWNIKLLKQRLIDEGLSQKHLFVYIFINITLYDFVLTGNYLLPSEDLNIYDYSGSIAKFFVVCLGTYLIYQVNGGPKGKQFAERFFSIYFVIGIRFLVFFFPIIILLLVGLLVEGDNGLIFNWFSTIIIPGLLVAYYWRIMAHVKEVANSTPA